MDSLSEIVGSFILPFVRECVASIAIPAVFVFVVIDDVFLFSGMEEAWLFCGSSSILRRCE